MNRSNKRYISMKTYEFKFCHKGTINMLESELNDITTKLHKLIFEFENKKDEIVFMKNLKYNHKRKTKRG